MDGIESAAAGYKLLTDGFFPPPLSHPHINDISRVYLSVFVGSEGFDRINREREKEREMDGKKQMGSSSSSSSFTADLFGSKESSASSCSGILGSIFPNTSKVSGRESGRSETFEKKDNSSQAWSTKQSGPQDTIPWSHESQNQNGTHPFNQEQRVPPCPLSSSIYYGGRDVYSQPQNTQASGNSTYNNDGGEDDLGSASRGNWWKGSLHY